MTIYLAIIASFLIGLSLGIVGTVLICRWAFTAVIMRGAE